MDIETLTQIGMKAKFQLYVVAVMLKCNTFDNVESIADSMKMTATGRNGLELPFPFPFPFPNTFPSPNTLNIEDPEGLEFEPEPGHVHPVDIR